MKAVLSIIIALFVIGCSDTKTETKTEVAEPKKVEVTQEKSTLDTATEKVEEAKEKVVSEVTEAKDKLTEKVADVKEDLSQKVEEAKEKTTDIVDSVKEKVAEATGSDIDADKLYNRCANCHGGMGEIAALGKSGVIRNWSVKQIEHALLGYKNGTYGRTMKAMMQSQVRNLSDAEIHALATYISDK